MNRRVFLVAFSLVCFLTVPAEAQHDKSLTGRYTARSRTFYTRVTIDSLASGAIVSNTVSISRGRTAYDVLTQEVDIDIATSDKYGPMGLLLTRLGGRENNDPLEPNKWWYMFIAPRLKITRAGNRLKLAPLSDWEVTNIADSATRALAFLPVKPGEGLSLTKLAPMRPFVSDELRQSVTTDRNLSKQLRKLEGPLVSPHLYFRYSYPISAPSSG